MRPTGLTVLVLLGCASTPDTTTPPATAQMLPFHAAVIPPEPVELPAAGDADADADVDEKDLVRFEPAMERLAEVVRGALDTRFTRTTLLDRPAGSLERESYRWDADQWDEWWVGQARAVGADVIVASELRYSPWVDPERGRLWASIPLFLVGGPFSWFVDDHSYPIDARLMAWIYDLAPVYRGHTTLREGRSLLTEVEVTAQEVKLDLTDRAGGAGAYATSIVVPPTFVGSDDEKVARLVAEEVGASLARRLVENLDAVADEILVADQVAPFNLSSDSRVVLLDGRAHFIGEVLQRCGDDARLARVVVRNGERTYEASFREGLPDDRMSTTRSPCMRYPMHVAIPNRSDMETLEVEISDDADPPRVRRYTLPVTRYEE